jgi:hypothetical protein
MGSGIWARPGWAQHPKIEADLTRRFDDKTVDVRLVPGGGWRLAVTEGGLISFLNVTYPTAEDAQIEAEQRWG